MTHTPGPLSIKSCVNLIAADGYTLTSASGTDSAKWRARAEANAQHAMLCWNTHDELLEVLKACLAERINIGLSRPFWTPRLIYRIRDAIDQAEGTEE